MQITDLLSQLGGLQSMARELGVTEAQAAKGAEALMPAILGGFKKQAAAQPSGLEGLGGMLETLGGGGLLDNVLSPQPTNIESGNNVLGQIFGSKDVSRAVAANAATHTGLDATLLKKMLPMLAMLAAGYMAKQRAGGASAPAAPAASGGMGGALGGLLGGLLGGGAQTGATSSTASGAGAMGGLAGMLDMNNDGNVLDDIMRMAGKVMK